MAMSSSRLSYSDCYELMSSALDDPRGVRARFGTYDAALAMRGRCYQARVIDRDESKIAYEPGHPMHGESVYDDLCLTIKGDSQWFWLYVEKTSARELVVESLSEEEQDGNDQLDASDYGSLERKAAE